MACTSADAASADDRDRVSLTVPVAKYVPLTSGQPGPSPQAYVPAGHSAKPEKRGIVAPSPIRIVFL